MAIKPVTYKKFIKDNNIPKDKQSSIIPKDAIIVNQGDLPIGLDSAVARTEGRGYDEYSAYDSVKNKIEIFHCRREHSQWWSWSPK